MFSYTETESTLPLQHSKRTDSGISTGIFQQNASSLPPHDRLSPSSSRSPAFAKNLPGGRKLPRSSWQLAAPAAKTGAKQRPSSLPATVREFFSLKDKSSSSSDEECDSKKPQLVETANDFLRHKKVAPKMWATPAPASTSTPGASPGEEVGAPSATGRAGEEIPESVLQHSKKRTDSGISSLFWKNGVVLEHGAALGFLFGGPLRNDMSRTTPHKSCLR